jgi:CubicO group peptidase (beta-lactamase class C family)
MGIWRLDPEVDPGTVGVDLRKLDKLCGRFEEAVDAGELFHGACVALYRDGKRVLDIGGGTARVRTGLPVAHDTMFVIFSATKGLAALAMLMLYERGKFHYDEPVTKYWPSFASAVPEKRSVTIRHIMGHRAGFPIGPDWLTARYWGDREAIRRAMEEIPLSWTPGEKNAYHPMNFGHMLNELMLRIDGRDCGRFLADEVFSPLGLTDIYLGLPDDEKLEARVAWCYNELRDLRAGRVTGVVSGEAPAEAPAFTFELSQAADDRRGEVRERAHPFNRPETHRAVLPASGGISTARDLARVYAALALGGELDGVKLVRKESLDHATTPTNRPDEIDGTVQFRVRWGTGWHMGLYGRGSTLRTFGHAGAGGQVAFADPDTGIAFAFLTNGELKPEFILWRMKLQSLAFEACHD